jgi:hypothetical protein
VSKYTYESKEGADLGTGEALTGRHRSMLFHETTMVEISMHDEDK